MEHLRVLAGRTSGSGRSREVETYLEGGGEPEYEQTGPDEFIMVAPGAAEPQADRWKPLQWRCPRCHRNVSPTARQADTNAHQQLTAGKTSLDMVHLAGTLESQ